MTNEEKVLLVREYRSMILPALSERLGKEIGAERASVLSLRVANIVSRMVGNTPELREMPDAALLLGLQCLVDNQIARGLADEFFLHVQTRVKRSGGGLQ